MIIILFYCYYNLLLFSVTDIIVIWLNIHNAVIIYTHEYMCMNTHTRIYMYIYIYIIHMYIYIYIHTHIFVYIYIYTHVCWDCRQSTKQWNQCDQCDCCQSGRELAWCPRCVWSAPWLTWITCTSRKMTCDLPLSIMKLEFTHSECRRCV